MDAASRPSAPRVPAHILSWRRLLFTLGAAVLLGLVLSPTWRSPVSHLYARTMLVGLVGLLAFGLFERWPKRLPGWLARWVLQVLGVSVTIPITVLVIYIYSTGSDQPPFWKDEFRLTGFALLSFTGLLLGPWMAMSAMLRQRDADARTQALAFELQRSELERKASDARLRLLQAQVEPHFLFNTLANVRALVDAGSPQASAVLGSLIDYLRAAVPRLHDPATTLGQELQLVRAYLDLMHMRIPDRLQFAIHVDDAAIDLRCPPMTLLPLVENAVCHGIDPSEEGGRIEVVVRVRNGRCIAQVIDTGAGLHGPGDGGLGTGLATLRERLQLAYGGDAQLRISDLKPRGVCAEVDFPATPAP